MGVFENAKMKGWKGVYAADEGFRSGVAELVRDVELMQSC